jgi:hypothetical protein
MGDMLVKAGDWKTAQNLYRNAQLSTTYNSWPYRKVLEARIEDAEANAAHFNAPKSSGENYKPIMVYSAFSCMGCHQE